MNEVLGHNLLLIKEHVGMFKAANNYDIYNPENGELIMTCREEKLGFFTKLLRFTDYKRMTPFHIEIKTAAGEKVLTVKRGISLFLSKVHVQDENDNPIGIFKQQFFSIGGKFKVMDQNENPLCTLKGHWASWDFSFAKGDVEFAKVSKKWAGIGKELFTTADNYMLKTDEHVPADHKLRYLILAAVVCIDMVLKE